MLGSYNRNISDHENNFKKNMRRSIVVKKFISKGKNYIKKRFRI